MKTKYILLFFMSCFVGRVNVYIPYMCITNNPIGLAVGKKIQNPTYYRINQNMFSPINQDMIIIYVLFSWLVYVVYFW